MKKWGIVVIIILILGGAAYAQWLSNKNTNVVVNILNSIPNVDSITVKDGNTKEELLAIPISDSSFSEIVEVYKFPYTHLKGSDKNILNEVPIAEVEYFEKSELKFTVSIIQLKDGFISDPPPEFYRYKYTPDEKNDTFIFSIRENSSLIVVNDGMKELMDRLSSKLNIE